MPAKIYTGQFLLGMSKNRITVSKITVLRICRLSVTVKIYVNSKGR